MSKRKGKDPAETTAGSVGILKPAYDRIEAYREKVRDLVGVAPGVKDVANQALEIGLDDLERRLKQ